ncbi:PREDICTED: FACT complex subunit SSRP1-like isoform X2 [Polistes dominula]|uniref:FACT complex subunit SSRP1-like isoform X2 n=1 Tax=Polistes dominula TaxID=743375 RepID=A0ABM1HWK8_POLDO|nr:PREDICTED: FACT complex subunit SSRP1-like isoform X2 [Polistes dominula]
MGNRNSTQPCKPHNDQKGNGNDSTGYRNGKTKKSQNVNDVKRNTQNLTKDFIGRRSTNPFIIFFLRLRSKKPDEHVTVIARAAGKLWTRMSPDQRKKYIDLANAEKKRREDRKRKRRCSTKLKQ